MNAQPQAAPQWVTEAEYLQYCEDHPEEKFELIDGEIVAMAGASRNHILIATNLIILLGLHLQDTDCSVLANDLKVKVEHNFYYPDLVVDCDSDDNQPKLIVEILSDSTRNIDLSIKLDDYKKISSLQEYVLIEQNTKFVLVYRRKNQWKGEMYQEGNIYLESIDLTLSMEDIYRKIVLKSKRFKFLK